MRVHVEDELVASERRRQAGTSSVVGTVNVPPGVDGVDDVVVAPDVVLVRRDRRDPPEHAARLKTVSAAATPPAPRRNTRRSIAARCAAHSISANVASAMSRSSPTGHRARTRRSTPVPHQTGARRQRYVPDAAHRVATTDAGAGEIDAVSRGLHLHRGEAIAVPARPLAQRRLGIDAPLPGDRDHRREQLHQCLPVRPVRFRWPGRDRSSRPSGTASVPGQQRRQVRRDPRDERVASLLLPLDLLPVAHDIAAALSTGDGAEHVRMAAHELRVDAPRHVGDRERARLAASTEWITTWNSRSPSSSSSASYAPAGTGSPRRAHRQGGPRSPRQLRTPLRAGGARASDGSAPHPTGNRPVPGAAR